MGLAFTLLRFGFLALLWFFVLMVMNTVRTDIEGTQIVSRSGSGGRMGRIGRRKRSHSEEPPAPATPQAIPDPMLVITAGPLAGSALPLGGQDVRIGRSPTNTLVIDDSYASSQHARIFFQDNSWWIEDLGSTNGTLVGNSPVRYPQRLQPGESITIGQTVMELQQ